MTNPHISPTDRLVEKVTGINVSESIFYYQKCVLFSNGTGFGGSNADLGGIGVITSLYILCVACALGSAVVTALGLTFDHIKDEAKLESRLDRLLMRIKEATSTSLATFLDTAIFFSLTLQFAGLLWLLQTEKYLTADNGCTFHYSYNMVESDYPCHTSSSDENISGKSGYAGHLYNTLLLLYTSLVTMCPLVTLANTPYFWQDIRRREFRLLAMILILIIGGVVNSYWTKAYNRNYEIDKATNNTFPNAVYHVSDSCIAGFIFAILPSNTEAKILRFSYALCASVLLLFVIVQWRRSCSGLISGWCQLLVRVFGSKASADPPGSRYEHPDTRPSREGRTDMESQTFLSRPTDFWSKRIPRYSRKLLFALVSSSIQYFHCYS